MSAINNGGPAFPRPGANWMGQENRAMGCDAQLGMTLRDYMAIHASADDVRDQCEVLRLNLAQHGLPGILPDGCRVTARYMHADAMLKAREEGGAA